MTGTEYRICASDTPSILASEVTELLSHGWELYGDPFVGGKNGHPSAGPLICQAMVKSNGNGHAPVPVAAPAAAPVVAPVDSPVVKTVKPQVKVAQPARPAVAATVRNIAIFLAVILCGCFLADALIFRSGFYGQFLEPLSSTGTFERTFYAEAYRPPSGKKEVLVLGNSRMAEGFSAKIANEYKADGYRFSNCAVPAAAGRAFFYFVRDVDPHRNRYAAIAIPIDDYNDIDTLGDPADWVNEMWLVINRLRLTDIVPYTMSFKSWEDRSIILRGTTLKGLVFQRDVQDLIEHTDARLESAKVYREHGADWQYAYGGNPGSLAGITVDWANYRAAFPPGMPADQQADLTRQIFQEPPQHGWVREFQIKWLGALADLYRGSQTKIVFFQLPRSAAPRPIPIAHPLPTSMDELRKRSWVRVVDHGAFEPLEKPELFFDFIHLNVDGRKLFSPMLADAVKASLQ